MTVRKEDDFRWWKSNFFFWLITSLLTAIAVGAVSWAAWTTMQVVAKVDAEQVRTIVQAESPFHKDRGLILQQIEDMREDRKALSNVIQKNTEAINSLKVEIAKIQR